MNKRTWAEQIFLAGVDRVLPERLISKSMSILGSDLFINDYIFHLNSTDHIYIIGAGKASALMAAEVEKILDDRISEGHIIVKHGHAVPLKKITVSEAGHPVPDARGFMAARSVLELACKAGRTDLVICLLSGGGSALLPDYPVGSSPEEIMILNNLLVNCGCPIGEINTVRKHLSDIKGGQLARAVYPATLVSLILSDVTGDPLDVIASGPTVPDPTTFRQAVEIVVKYKLTDSLPAGISKYLNEGVNGGKPETPKQGDHVFDRTINILVGNNRLALEAAGARAKDFKMNVKIVNDKIEGDVNSVSEYIVESALRVQRDKRQTKPVCLLFGGEPTVKMTGGGAGGRNQHLALLCARLLRNQDGITMLSAGTDGNDGPTSAAGAVVDSDTINDALSKNIDPDIYIREFDSYNFFIRAGGHIITGPTMTNVMDMIVVIVDDRMERADNR
jgi:glycerate 2-kinase